METDGIPYTLGDETCRTPSIKSYDLYPPRQHIPRTLPASRRLGRAAACGGGQLGVLERH